MKRRIQLLLLLLFSSAASACFQQRRSTPPLIIFNNAFKTTTTTSLKRPSSYHEHELSTWSSLCLERRRHSLFQRQSKAVEAAKRRRRRRRSGIGGLLFSSSKKEPNDAVARTAPSRFAAMAVASALAVATAATIAIPKAFAAKATKAAKAVTEENKLEAAKALICSTVDKVKSAVSAKCQTRKDVIVLSVVSLLSLWLLQTMIFQLRVWSRQRKDATSEWSRYAKHPAARARALGWLLCVQLFPVYVVAKVFKFLRIQPISNLLFKWSGNWLATGLLQLGPLYIKLGQIVSCRANWLPEPWMNGMAILQDRVPAKSGEEAYELAQQVWGNRMDPTSTMPLKLDDVFVDFDTTPLAAASLGQVHCAKLKSTGAPVALKLQRPYLRDIYNQDLTLLTNLASLIDKLRAKQSLKAITGGGVQQSWTQIFSDAKTILYREIDYITEAEQSMRFSGNFGLTRGGQSTATDVTSQDGQPLPSAASWLRTPYIYRQLSNEQVLVMEYVPSIKITHRQELAAAGVTQADCDYLAEMLARAYLRQFTRHLFFSTDPHPGNLGVEVLDTTKSKPEQRVRLVVYDFGQAATLTPDQATGILTILQAIVDADVERSIQAFTEMKVLTDDADLDIVRAKVAENYRSGKVKANRKRLERRGYLFDDTKSAINATATEVKDSAVMKYFTLPAEYAFVGRALTQMDGVGKSLDAEFDFVSAAAPWIYEIQGAARYVADQGKKWAREFRSQVLMPTYVPGKNLTSVVAEGVASAADKVKQSVSLEVDLEPTTPARKTESVKEESTTTTEQRTWWTKLKKDLDLENIMPQYVNVDVVSKLQKED